MKKYLFLLIISVVFATRANAQFIEENTLDKFTQTQTLQTSFEKIGSSNPGNVKIALRAINNTVILRLKWGVGTIIEKGENVIFLDDEGNKYPFHVIELTTSKRRGPENLWEYMDIFTIGDWEAMKGKTITDLRIISVDGYTDITIKSQGAKRINRVWEIFDKSLLR